MTMSDGTQIPPTDRVQAIKLATICDQLRAPATVLLGYGGIIVTELERLGLSELKSDGEQIVVAAQKLIAQIDELLAADRAGGIAETDPVKLASVERTLRHDLRTPLNGIQGYGEILLEDTEDMDCAELRDDIAKLLAENQHLLGRINAVVRFRADAEPEEGDADAETERAKVITDKLVDDMALAERYTSMVREKGNILVVDDNESNCNLLRRMLTRDGHSVTAVESGRTALGVMMKQDFDLVLLDLMMSGMNGLEVLCAIKADPQLRSVPVLMISALDERESAIICIKAGADDYLTKPIEPILLQARIGNCLSKKRLHDRERQHLQSIEAEKAKSERLLLNILPQDIVARLNSGEKTIADCFSDVSVLFSDFVGFTRISSHLSPSDLVVSLNAVFSRFDELALKLGAEKVKTIGDAYMVVAGLPQMKPDHPRIMADMALGMLDILSELNPSLSHGFEVRIGMHCGPVVAGIIGRHKFVYDVWGDAVNTASRMESYAQPGTIHMSAEMAARLQPGYRAESLGIRDIRGKGRIETYRLLGRNEEADICDPMVDEYAEPHRKLACRGA